mmetsp:Transcript_18924/g.40745  ORF Transcript_18924/g.40745 Transcript_18924/m.40745 type:complete len:477 (+) Transcript_18924:120-1550(+)
MLRPFCCILPVLIIVFGGVPCALSKVNATDRAPIVPHVLGPDDPDYCMNTTQLSHAIKQAAWRKVINGQEERAIILVSCDLYCMENLLEPYLAYLQHAKGAPANRHAIIVSNGEDAHAFCTVLQAQYSHQCVLDRLCNPYVHMEHGGIHYRNAAYYLALVQKLIWAVEVLRRGVAVLWLDLDIVVLSNPLEHLYRWPDADFMISPETWHWNRPFAGEVQQWDPSLPWAQNGGLWLARPTPRGRQLMEMWCSQYLVYGVVEHGIELQDMPLDQDVLDSLVKKQTPSVPRVELTAGGKYSVNGEIEWPAGIRLYRLSMINFQSRCYSPCGMATHNRGGWHQVRPPLPGSSSRQRAAAAAGGRRMKQQLDGSSSSGSSSHVSSSSGSAAQGLIALSSLPGFGRGPVLPRAPPLTCAMPQEALDQAVTFHMNCLESVYQKRLWMARYWNITVVPPRVDSSLVGGTSLFKRLQWALVQLTA